LAEAIHHLDPKRRSKHFATVNCSAITGTLAESELFGHCKGAFTGATSDRLGYFRSCHGGTLFLDEISELDINLQPKLLRALQDGKVLPVGSDREFAVDVRVIASSNKPMAQIVADGDFRLDLYQRLKVVSLSVPPLRDRLEDIPLLVNAFLKRYGHYYSGQIVSVDPQVYSIFSRAKLPGNVRELENIIRQALVLKESGSKLEISDLPEELIAQAAGRPARQEDLISTEFAGTFGKMLLDGQASLPQLVEFFEKTLITQAMDSWSSTYSELAKQLGVTRRTFYNKLQKYAIAQPSSS
jgi:transcriptional regulator with PAS, ATPase and Fis domain